MGPLCCRVPSLPVGNASSGGPTIYRGSSTTTQACRQQLELRNLAHRQILFGANTAVCFRRSLVRCSFPCLRHEFSSHVLLPSLRGAEAFTQWKCTCVCFSFERSETDRSSAPVCAAINSFAQSPPTMKGAWSSGRGDQKPVGVLSRPYPFPNTLSPLHRTELPKAFGCRQHLTQTS